LTFNGSAESDGGLFSITGGAGADVITGGAGAGAGGAGDTITGGAGDDTITLGTAGSVDVVVFGATGALNGSDTISTFTVAADKFDVTAFLTSASHVAAAESSVAALATEGTSIAVADNKILFAEGHATATTGFDTAAEIVTGIANGGAFDAIDVAASASAILVFGAAGTATTMYVYAVENDTTAAIATGEITLIGIINGATGDIGTISVTTNFVV
jgi:S-layer protein